MKHEGRWWGRERGHGWIFAGCVIWLLFAGLFAAGPLEARQAPPGDEYRTLETARFRVTYGPGLASLAERTVEVAEHALDELSAWFLPAPEGVTDILLTDHADFSNGFAQVFPSNRIVVFVEPPLAGTGLAHFDSWIDLVVTHEVTHIVQLDHAGTLGNLARSVFGRPPWTWPTYPGYAAGLFGVEGVAVLAETRHSTAGRLESGFFESIARTQVLGGVAETASQVLGDSPYWPGGARPYIFGSLFFDYVEREHGRESVTAYFAALSDQWIPYRLDAAAEEAFGTTFTGLWADWTERMLAGGRALAERTATSPRGYSDADVVKLTDGARNGLYAAPRPGSPETVAYMRADGRSDPRLVLMEDGVERTLASWNSVDPPRWTPTGDLVLTQLEYVDRYRVLRDLYRVALDGTVTRLTSGLRIQHPDPHPTDGSIVAVVSAGGTNRLVLLDRSGIEVRELAPPAPGTLWSYPRWSPDGTRIAAVRRAPDGRSAIVVLDAQGRELLSLMDELSQQTGPTWGPTGETLYWASDRTGVPNLYFAGVSEGTGTPLQVTDLTTGGTAPAVEDNGRWIYFSLLGTDGWDIARVPYVRRGAPPGPLDPRFGSVADAPAAPPVEVVADRPYSAIPTLFPRYWEPVRAPGESSLGRDVLDTAWGARTSGRDLVGRHAYEASAAASLGEGLRRWEWSGQYAWAGLGNPVLFVDAAQSWEARAPLLALPEGAPPAAAPDTLLSATRERWYGGGVEVRRQRVRSTLSLLLTARRIHQDRRLFELDGTETERFSFTRPRPSLLELGVSAGWSNARSHDFSVATEDGVSVSIRLRRRWDTSVPDELTGVKGSDGAFRDAVVTFQGYEGIGGPGFADHVLAFRAAAGAADGPGSGSGHFSVGGGRGGTLGFLGGTIGSGPRQFPVRGVTSGALRGDTAWTTTLEWRFPLAAPRTGAGALPIYIDRIAGGMFVDLGGVGLDDAEDRRVHRTVGSIGLEIALFHSRFFEGTEVVRVGLAKPVSVPTEVDDGPSLYLEAGWSF